MFVSILPDYNSAKDNQVNPAGEKLRKNQGLNLFKLFVIVSFLLILIMWINIVSVF